VKVWNMHGTEPELLEKKNIGVGEVLAGGFCKYAGHLIVAAGDTGTIKVWDLRVSSTIVQHFPESVYIPQIYRSDTGA